MSISEINKEPSKNIPNIKSYEGSNLNKDKIFPKISKVIKIRKVSKHISKDNNSNINKNININSNTIQFDNKEKDKDIFTKDEHDDFNFILNESLKMKNSIKNSDVNLIIEKQEEINIKTPKNNKKLIQKGALINQHIESIQLSYKYNIKINTTKTLPNLRKKLNKNLNSIKNDKNKLDKISPIINLDLNNPQIMNQFINNNIANYTMLKNMNFFERLNSISEKRNLEFKKEFQKDYYFLDIDQFDNIFINENDMNINSPLTLIFHYCLNPEIKQSDSGTYFFEYIYKKRGDTDYSMVYDKEEIKSIPKYFNDINYVNYLFNNFNEKHLNNFLNGISSWKKTFLFKQKFKYAKHVVKNMTLRDFATIYFISPLDMVVDYHSYGSDYPMADYFVAISQYRFHCDINFDKKKGRFNFKTSCKIYNTIKLVKQTLLKKYVIKESNVTNQKEIQVNIWPSFKKIIKKEDKNNQELCSYIFETYLKNNLNKYSKVKPDEKIYFDFFIKNSDNNEIKKTSVINLDSAGTNFDIFSNNNNEFNLFNNNINIINNIKLKEGKDQEKDLYKNIYQIKDNKKNGITKEENDDKEEKKPKRKKWRKRRILKYGVCIVFGLYVFKTLISLGKGYFSNEKKINIFLIIIIGLVLATIHLRKK